MSSKREIQSLLKVILKYLLLGIVIGLFLVPFYWMISLSFKPDAEIFTENIKLLPHNWVIKNYLYIWKKTIFGRYFLNSIIVGTSVATITTVISMLAAYSFSRLTFPGRHILLGIVISAQTLPFVLILIPIFSIFKRFSLIDTYWGLIIAHTIFALPLSTLMLVGYFRGIPQQIEEAAMIDGCSRLGILLKVLLPIIAPGLVAVIIFAFVLSWHEYLFALTLMRTQTMRTLPVGIALFKGAHRVLWGPVMASAVSTIGPVVILFLFFQRFIVKGLTAGAMKG